MSTQDPVKLESFNALHPFPFLSLIVSRRSQSRSQPHVRSSCGVQSNVIIHFVEFSLGHDEVYGVCAFVHLVSFAFVVFVWSCIPNLGIDVTVIEVFGDEMSNRIPLVHYPVATLEGFGAKLCKQLVSHSRRSESIDAHRIPLLPYELQADYRGESSSQTVPRHHYLHYSVQAHDRRYGRDYRVRQQGCSEAKPMMDCALGALYSFVYRFVEQHVLCVIFKIDAASDGDHYLLQEVGIGNEALKVAFCIGEEDG